MAKRLYQITDTKSGKSVPDLFFADKPSAKIKRQELNDQVDEGAPKHLRFVVSPGPDHRNFRK